MVDEARPHAAICGADHVNRDIRRGSNGCHPATSSSDQPTASAGHESGANWLGLEFRGDKELASHVRIGIGLDLLFRPAGQPGFTR